LERRTVFTALICSSLLPGVAGAARLLIVAEAVLLETQPGGDNRSLVQTWMVGNRKKGSNERIRTARHTPVGKRLD
jgi:hypothetical protein